MSEVNREQECACGHRREDHAGRTMAGVCFECYGASNHGQQPYCNRFHSPVIVLLTPDI